MLKLQTSVATTAALRYKCAEIALATDPWPHKSPKSEFSWKGVPTGTIRATLYARVWRANGLLACYFTTGEGRKFQLTAQYDEDLDSWGAEVPGIDFASDEVKNGDRFILVIELARSGKRVWVKAHHPVATLADSRERRNTGQAVAVRPPRGPYIETLQPREIPGQAVAVRPARDGIIALSVGVAVATLAALGCLLRSKRR